MNALQKHFHDLIKADLAEYEYTHFLHLPDLSSLSELEVPEMWFPLPFLGDGRNVKNAPIPRQVPHITD
jgi:hypothetical protein